MLRDRNLIPLSRQHQHALALCVRLNRAQLATVDELKAWQSEIQQHFASEIQYHFAAEEAHLFPPARQFEELRPIVDELLAEHTQLRRDFAQAGLGSLDRAGVLRFAETLAAHIRKEERQLFEGMQKLIPGEELARIGALVEQTLAAAPEACIPPTEATLRSRNS